MPTLRGKIYLATVTENPIAGITQQVMSDQLSECSLLCASCLVINIVVQMKSICTRVR